MLQSLGSRQTIRDSDSTEFYERRIVVSGGSINTVTLCALCNPAIVRVWIPNSIIFLNKHRPIVEFGITKEPESLELIVFESNSRLPRIDCHEFDQSSLQSIAIPSNVEILGSYCFYWCKSLSSITFESNSRLTRIESFAFSSSSLESILIPRNVEILGSLCFYQCRSLSSTTFESNSHLTRIKSGAFSHSSLQSIIIPRNVEFIDGSAFDAVTLSSISIEAGNEIFIV
jgi:hypothetical protein